MATRLIPRRKQKDADALAASQSNVAAVPPQAPNPLPDSDSAVMGFFEHLEELRKRLFRAMIGLAAGVLISIAIANPIIAYIASSSGLSLQAISPTETISVFFRVSLMLGAIFASPFITWQLLMFIIPGLTAAERRGVLSAIPAITFMFLFGVVFTWFVLMPAYTNFLSGFQSNVIKAAWTADSYFGFATSVLFWHGVAFETPVFFFVLGKLGIVTGKQMMKYWRHAMVGSAIFAGFIAPTYDPLTMVMITAILFGLYMFSVLLVAVSARNTARRNSAAA